MSTWNKYLVRVAMSHQLDKAEIVEICLLGGLEISGSRAEGWKRSTSDTRRHVRMTESEFDAFTTGLVTWAKNIESES